MNSTTQLAFRHVARTGAGIRPDELVVDLFAGGGGASTGIEEALGRAVDIAVNHDADAIEMHTVNHPGTAHLHSDVFEVDPREACAGRPVGLLWASPDCTHFSRAKGGKPRDKAIRGLAWVVVDWARAVAPRVICLENVPEFETWGPLLDDGRPCPARAGHTFAEFVGALRAEGYAVEWRSLVAADYGAPTTRKRLFLVARRDGLPIRWPEPTHGPSRPLPWRTAAECIDWSIPCPSIFDRKRPLAEATERRIAEGIRRFVLEAKRPFIVQTGHQSSDAGKVRPADAPLSTVVTKAEHLLVAPTLVHRGNGERTGQAPRVYDVQRPLGTVVAGGQKHGLVAAFLAKHNGKTTGQRLGEPVHAVTGRDTKALAAVHLTKFQENSAGQAADAPLHTVMAGAQRFGLVAAFLCKYYGAGVGQDLRAPLRTIPTVDRFGLVVVELGGELWALVDIGLRMLEPHELLAAQFGPERAGSYVLTGSQRSQVARIGNSVCPDQARAVVAANVGATDEADLVGRVAP